MTRTANRDGLQNRCVGSQAVRPQSFCHTNIQRSHGFEHPVQQLFVVMGAEAWTTCFEDLASSFHARKLLQSFTVRVSAAMDRQDWTINWLI
jgi:hypothetical protein